MALASPVVSRNDNGQLHFVHQSSKDMMARMDAAHNVQRAVAASASVASAKLQEHHVLRLVDAMNIAFEDRRRSLSGENRQKTERRSSFASKADTKSVIAMTAIVDRPAYMSPDQRSPQTFPFLSAP
jgi:hypothetical protein